MCVPVHRQTECKKIDNSYKHTDTIRDTTRQTHTKTLSYIEKHHQPRERNAGNPECACESPPVPAAAERPQTYLSPRPASASTLRWPRDTPGPRASSGTICQGPFPVSVCVFYRFRFRKRACFLPVALSGLDNTAQIMGRMEMKGEKKKDKQEK